MAQFESRLARLSGEAHAAELRDLNVDGELHLLLAEAIRRPAVRTDVAGAIFISSTSPFER